MTTLNIHPDFFDDFVENIIADMINVGAVDPSNHGQLEQLNKILMRRLTFQHYLQTNWKDGDVVTPTRIRMDRPA